MNTKHYRLIAGLLLAMLGTGFGQAPVITVQPTNQTACFGTDATFTVGVTGAEPLVYHWQKTPDGVNFTDPPGCTNAALVITNVQPADNLYYRVVITNSEGAVTSSLAYLFPAYPSVIPSQPTNWTPVSLGATVGNRVAPNGTPPFTYQWRLNGVPIPGQTGSFLTITNVQLADAGNYDVVVSNMCRSIISSNVMLVVDPTFTKITTGPVVTNRANFLAGSWADYDDDGFIDLFVPAGSDDFNQRPALYHNIGGTNFVNMSGDVVGARPYCYEGLWADFNNDGFLDLLEIGATTSFDASNRLFFGRSDRTFDWVGSVGENPPTGSWQCALVDYDNDGAADVFHTTGYGAGGTRDVLYRNRSDGTFSFTWSPDGPFMTTSQYGCWADYDNDGDRDLWLLGMGPQGQFYRNNGNGTFTYITDGSIPPSPSVLAVWGDYDNDGYLDCINGKWLFHNNQGANLTLVRTLPYDGFGRWGDYDNDGDLDLVCGWWNRTPSRFYRNDGGGAFTLMDLGSPSHDIPANESIQTWGDYDNDGFLDLFVATRGHPGTNFLYRNSGIGGGNKNHWLIVKPRGIASNYSAIGAKVRVEATIRGVVTKQMREIAGAYFDDLRAHFGLGDATNVDVVRVEWTSGIVQELTNVAPGQILTVVESQGYVGSLPAVAGATISTNGLQISIIEPASPAVYALQASTDLVNWTKLMARTSAGGSYAYTDTRSATYPRRFYRVVVP